MAKVYRWLQGTEAALEFVNLDAEPATAEYRQSSQQRAAVFPA